MTNLMKATPQGNMEMSDDEQMAFLVDQAAITAAYMPPPVDLAIQLTAILINNNIIQAASIDPQSLQSINSSLAAAKQPAIISNNTSKILGT